MDGKTTVDDFIKYGGNIQNFDSMTNLVGKVLYCISKKGEYFPPAGLKYLIDNYMGAYLDLIEDQKAIRFGIFSENSSLLVGFLKDVSSKSIRRK